MSSEDDDDDEGIDPHLLMALIQMGIVKVKPPPLMKKGDQIKGYEFLGQLGEGGFGEVWAVKKNDQLFAIKVMKNDKDVAGTELIFSDKLHLKNPFLVEYFESFRSSDNALAFIVMELCKQGDLNDLVNKFDPAKGIGLQAHRIMKIFTQLILGLHELHKNNIIHRDLKLGNVFVDENDNIKIGDFGAARILKSAGELRQTMVGTPLYMSPEQYSKEAYGQGVDLWALGVMMYKLCTGKIPFMAQTEEELEQKIKIGVYAPIPKLTVPNEIITAIDNLLNKNAKARPTTTTLLKIPLIQECAVDSGLIKFFPKDLRLKNAPSSLPGGSWTGGSAPASSAPQPSTPAARPKPPGPGGPGPDGPGVQNRGLGGPGYGQGYGPGYGPPPGGGGGGGPSPENGDGGNRRCKYGAACYNKDPDHIRQYHPEKAKGGGGGGDDDGGGKICPFDSKPGGCTRKNPDHFKEMRHPNKDRKEKGGDAGPGRGGGPPGGGGPPPGWVPPGGGGPPPNNGRNSPPPNWNGPRGGGGPPPNWSGPRGGGNPPPNWNGPGSGGPPPNWNGPGGGGGPPPNWNGPGGGGGPPPNWNGPGGGGGPPPNWNGPSGSPPPNWNGPSGSPPPNWNGPGGGGGGPPPNWNGPGGGGPPPNWNGPGGGGPPPNRNGPGGGGGGPPPNWNQPSGGGGWGG